MFVYKWLENQHEQVGSLGKLEGLRGDWRMEMRKLRERLMSGNGATFSSLMMSISKNSMGCDGSTGRDCSML